MDLRYKQIQEAKANALKQNFTSAHNIDEISSQISKIWHVNPSASSISHADEDQEQEINELDLMSQAVESEHKKKTAEDLQRFFFSKCLALKLASSKRDPSQCIQIQM